MTFDTISVTLVFEIFLMLLIGIGPKLALVPFLEATAGMPLTTKRIVLRRMLITASIVAALLLGLGGLLTRLLHFSPGSLSVASGIILLLIAVRMVMGRESPEVGTLAIHGKDPIQLATVPLGVPYLLNPAGIVILVTASAEADSASVMLVVAASLTLVILVDIAVFRWATTASEGLVQNRMLVIEMVFGFLLAALAVQLAVNGLSDLGVINVTSH